MCYLGRKFLRFEKCLFLSYPAEFHQQHQFRDAACQNHPHLRQKLNPKPEESAFHLCCKLGEILYRELEGVVIVRLKTVRLVTQNFRHQLPQLRKFVDEHYNHRRKRFWLCERKADFGDKPKRALRTNHKTRQIKRGNTVADIPQCIAGGIFFNLWFCPFNYLCIVFNECRNTAIQVALERLLRELRLECITLKLPQYVGFAIA